MTKKVYKNQDGYLQRRVHDLWRLLGRLLSILGPLDSGFRGRTPPRPLRFNKTPQKFRQKASPTQPSSSATQRPSNHSSGTLTTHHSFLKIKLVQNHPNEKWKTSHKNKMDIYSNVSIIFAASLVVSSAFLALLSVDSKARLLRSHYF